MNSGFCVAGLEREIQMAYGCSSIAMIRMHFDIKFSEQYIFYVNA